MFVDQRRVARRLAGIDTPFVDAVFEGDELVRLVVLSESFSDPGGVAMQPVKM